MGRFSRHKRREMPTLNTSSLPDLIFTLLFFFMVGTTMKEANVKVRFRTPVASEVQKLQRKSLVTYIYIGYPMRQTTDSLARNNWQIQVNDAFVSLKDIEPFLYKERASLTEEEQQKMSVSLKVDKHVPMGIVTDIKKAARSAGIQNINYSVAKYE